MGIDTHIAHFGYFQLRKEYRWTNRTQTSELVTVYYWGSIERRLPLQGIQSEKLLLFSTYLCYLEVEH